MNSYTIRVRGAHRGDVEEGLRRERTDLMQRETHECTSQFCEKGLEPVREYPSEQRHLPEVECWRKSRTQRQRLE